MLSKKISIVFLPILIVTYFILFRFNVNIDELSINDFFSAYIVFIVITIIVLIPTIFIKQKLKYSLFLSAVFIIFFSYIPIHDYFYTFDLFDITLGSHKILIPTILGMFSLGLYFLIKSKHDFKKISVVFSGIFSILIIFIVVEIVMVTNIPIITTYDEDQSFVIDENNLRDVYVIILDEYSNSQVLSNYFNHDNSEFDNFLKKNGFFIPETTFANYIETRLALPSFLNMNYVNLDHELKSEQDMVLKKITTNNLVMSNFQNLGYEIIYFHEENNLQPIDTSKNKLCSSFFTNILLVFVLDNTPVKIIQNLSDPYHQEEMIENRLCIFNELPMIKSKFTSPVLVHAHINLPHAPILFDSEGNTFSQDLPNTPSNYVEQLKFTNYKVMQVVEKLLDQEPQPIIIILSDHGYRWQIDWSSPTIRDYQISFPNYIALYFPGNSQKLNDDYSTMTPVNVYRILFNTYFETDYALLENKMFFRENYYGDVDGTPILTNIPEKLIVLNNTS